MNSGTLSRRTGAAMISRLNVALVAIGITVRTAVFLSPGSLWLDELALAHTIVVRPLARLVTEPLAYYQVAPAGFVALQRLSVSAFGDSDLSWRLVPWIASIVALVLFWRVAVRVLPPLAASFAVALFAASPAVVVYAGQAKQYASDVAAVVVLLWAGLELTTGSGARVRRAVAASTAALLVSLPGVIAGATVGVVLLWQSFRHRVPGRRTMIVVGICWTVAAAVTGGLSRLMVSPQTNHYMREFWARGFAPPPWVAPLWIPLQLFNVLAHAVFWFLAEDPIVHGVALILGVATVPGIWWLWRGSRPAALLVVAPVAGASLAALTRLMPLDGRTALWLAPSVIILAAAGCSQVRDWLPSRLRTIVPALEVLIAAAVSGALVFSPAFARSQDLAPALKRIAREAKPGDAIYVYYGARQAVRFYGPRAGLAAWDEGGCHRGNPRAYFREVDRYRGRPRVWVIWTHALPQYREIDMLTSYLASIGREVGRIESPSGTDGQDGAQALLYDLSDPVMLARTTAEHHEVLSPALSEGRLVPCGGPAADASTVR